MLQISKSNLESIHLCRCETLQSSSFFGYVLLLLTFEHISSVNAMNVDCFCEKRIQRLNLFLQLKFLCISSITVPSHIFLIEELNIYITADCFSFFIFLWPVVSKHFSFGPITWPRPGLFNWIAQRGTVIESQEFRGRADGSYSH